MDRMIGAGARAAQDAPAASGIAKTTSRRVGEVSNGDIMRAGGEEQKPAGSGQLSSKPRQLAVAAQRRRNVPLRAREGRRVGDDDVEALAGGSERSRFGEHLGAAERAAFRDLAAPRCGFGKRQRRFGTVDAEHRSGARARGRHREPAAVAIKVEHARTTSQSGDKAAVVALIEEPAGLLTAQDRKSTRLNSSHRTISYAV